MSDVKLMGKRIEQFNPKNFTYFVKPTYYDMSNLRLEGLKKTAEIVQWGRKNPIKFCERFFGIEFLDYQKYVFMESWITPYVVWCMSRNAGKALDLDTRIPTPSGDKTMRDIHVGDYVFDDNGNSTLVTYESTVYYQHRCYRLIFDDGEEIIADADHNWYVNIYFNNRMIHNNVVVTSGDIFRNFKIFEYSIPHGIKNKTIVDIRPIRSLPVKCIQVDSKNHLYLCGNKNTITHNTTLGSPFLMAKTLLIPYFEGYILSGTGAQSIGMMKKIEQIAKKEIASFTGLTDVFMNELVKSQANSNGFSHNPNSWTYKLYSGSTLATVNSNFDASRGKRSRLNFYDEASYVPEEMFVATLPFVTQNSDFALGGDIDVSLLPPNFPNQIIMASSAGSVDDYFYRMYKEYSLHSFAGDKRYACFDIDCDLVIKATYNGKIYPVPLLTQEKIDSEMKINPIKANREYRNKFDIDGGDQIIVKKSQILRNSFVRPPEITNADGKGLYLLAWDLAAKKDNSILSVGKLLHSNKRGWNMEVVNCINLLDKETKKPLTTPEQVTRVREEIVNYNGVGNPDYKQIKFLMMDAGSGGGASQVLGYLFDDFYEEHHDGDSEYHHKGLIDKTYDFCQPYIKRYPENIDLIRMIEPTKYKVQMYTELIELIEQELITFTADYDYHGILTFLKVEDGEEKEEIYKLSYEEEQALKQIDAMKEEVTHMYRYKSSNGNIRYDLAPGFENLIGDDRSYTLALLAHGLAMLRQEDNLRQRKPKSKISDLKSQFTIRQPKKVTRF